MSATPALSRLKDIVAGKLREHAALLACPRCGKPLTMQGSDEVRCPARHAFQVGRTGLVRFAPSSPSGGEAFYDRALWEARSAVFAMGFFDPLLQVLRRRLGATTPRVIVDAGSGEGSLLARLRGELGPAHGVGIGLDLSDDGVRHALRLLQRPEGARLLIVQADVRRLPLAGDSVDALINCLTPADHREFQRVLRPGGWFIKVFTGPSHLRELQGGDDVGEAEKVLAHTRKHWPAGESERVTVTRTCTPDEVALLRRMTPLLRHQRDAVPVDDVSNVTLDVHVFTAQRSWPSQDLRSAR